jgi:hypothetical protein
LKYSLYVVLWFACLDLKVEKEKALVSICFKQVQSGVTDVLLIGNSVKLLRSYRLSQADFIAYAEYINDRILKLYFSFEIPCKSELMNIGLKWVIRS